MKQLIIWKKSKSILHIKLIVFLLSSMLVGCDVKINRDDYVFSSSANPNERFEVPFFNSKRIVDSLLFDKKNCHNDTLVFYNKTRKTMGYREYRYLKPCTFSRLGNNRLLIKLGNFSSVMHYLVLDTLSGKGKIYNIPILPWDGKRMLRTRYQSLTIDSVRTDLSYFFTENNISLKINAEYSRPLFFELGGFRQERIGDVEFNIKGCIECLSDDNNLEEVLEAEVINAKLEGRKFENIKIEWLSF